MLSEKQIQEAQRLCDAATPGEWKTENSTDVGTLERHDDPNDWFLVADCSVDYDDPEDAGLCFQSQKANARFIAASRSLLPRALEHIRRQQEVIEVAKTAMLSVERQHYGLHHSWAGFWAECEECHDRFSYVANWEPELSFAEGNPPAKCPTCRLRAALARITQLEAKE